MHAPLSCVYGTSRPNVPWPRASANLVPGLLLGFFGWRRRGKTRGRLFDRRRQDHLVEPQEILEGVGHHVDRLVDRVHPDGVAEVRRRGQTALDDLLLDPAPEAPPHAAHEDE